MKKFLLIMAIFCSSQLPIIAKPYQIEVTAYVGDQIITSHDVVERIKILLVQTGGKLGDISQEALFNQTRELLIDEQIRVLAAEKARITVSEEEIDRLLNQLAAQNNLAFDEMINFFAANQISTAELRKQIRGQLLWRNFILSQLRPQLNLSQPEIDQYFEVLNSSQNQQQVLVSQIILENNGQDQQLAMLADEIYQKVKDDAGSFLKIASQLNGSQNESPIWYNLREFEPQIRVIIENLAAGEVSQPIKLPGQIILLKLFERQNNQASLSEEEIRERLFFTKLNNKSERYFRDLKRSIYIERK